MPFAELIKAYEENKRAEHDGRNTEHCPHKEPPITD
jgi:hypothetical protein